MLTKKLKVTNQQKAIILTTMFCSFVFIMFVMITPTLAGNFDTSVKTYGNNFLSVVYAITKLAGIVLVLFNAAKLIISAQDGNASSQYGAVMGVGAGLALFFLEQILKTIGITL